MLTANNPVSFSHLGSLGRWALAWGASTHGMVLPCMGRCFHAWEDASTHGKGTHETAHVLMVHLHADGSMMVTPSPVSPPSPQIAPRNIARFNMKERTYKFEPMVEQTIVHYATDGWLLHRGGEEAKKQLDLEKMEAEASARFQAELDRAAHDKHGGEDGEGPDDSKQLRNQFNFSERAAQTTNFPLRDRDTHTEPPPTATVSGESAHV